ncbi:MAG: hypothetical protein ACK5CO_10715 [Bacteroidota bacterium]|jgi:hypothetical protein
MMNTSIKLFLLVPTILLCVACNSKKENDSYTQTIDSLSMKLEKTDSIFESIAFEKAEKVAVTIAEKIEKINALDGGKHDDKTIELISAYSLVRWFENQSGEEEEREKKGIKEVKETEEEPKEMLEKQLEYSKSQLQNLRHDYVNGKFEKEEASRYLADEKRAIDKLYTYTENKSLQYKMHFAAFDSLDVLVDSVILKLSKK